MLKAPPFRLDGALNRRRHCGRLPRKPKKILNRGNEPKDLLETQHLAVLGVKNEPKANSILSAKSAYQSGKVRFRVPGVGGWGLGARSGFRIRDSGVRVGRAGGRNRE